MFFFFDLFYFLLLQLPTFIFTSCSKYISDYISLMTVYCMAETDVSEGPQLYLKKLNKSPKIHTNISKYIMNCHSY